jgi:RNA polymerase sigma factor (sigma-70 family)
MIRRVVDDQRFREASDSDLLARFITRREEPAFRALLCRHGPMVWQVCRSVLGREADAEDAFQATFLILVRKAASIRKTAALASWLHGVAYRTALKARLLAARQKPVGRPPARPVAAADDLSWQEACQVLHEELAGMSERYRLPLVLCYLEGRTQDEAAALLRLAKTSLKERLERGRALLRARLVRRGLGPAAVLLSTAWPAATVSAGVPVKLLGTTVQAATLVGAAKATAAGLVSPNVTLLTQEALRTMFVNKFTITALVGTGLLVLAALLGDVTRLPVAVPAAQAADNPKDKPADQDSQAKTPKGSKPLLTLKGHSHAVNDVAFSPTGKLIASACADHTIMIWDAATGKEIKTLSGHPDGVAALAFSRDGKQLASASGGSFGPARPDAVKVWDVASWEEKVTLKDNAGAFGGVAFSPDGKVLAALSDNALKLWDTATGKCRATAAQTGPIPADTNYPLAFSPDGKTLVLGSGKFGDVEEPIHLFDLSANKPNGSLKTDGRCRFLAFTADGKTLVSVNSHMDLTLWDFANSRERTTVKLKKNPPVGIAVSADGKVLALTYRVFEKKGEFNESRGRVELLDTATGKLLQTLRLDLAAQGVAFAPTGRLLAVGCRGREKYAAKRDTIRLGDDAEGDLNGTVRIWELSIVAGPARK